MKSTLKTHMVGGLALAVLALTPAALAQTVLIENAKIWTGTEAGTVDDASLLLRDGEIVAINPFNTGDIDEADRVDAQGGWVTPGIIAPFTRLGLVEVVAEDSTNDSDSGESRYSVSLNAADGFNPEASPIDVTRIEGVTHIGVAPGESNNMFLGQGFIANTSGDFDSIVEEKSFLFVRMGEAGAGRSGGSRAANWAYFRSALRDAATFPARYTAHQEGDALNRADAMALIPASRGEQLILIEARRASDLMAVARFSVANPELKIAILGADEGWKVADQLAEAHLPVIIDPYSNLPENFEQIGARADNAKLLIEAGVLTAFTYMEDDGHQPRLVLQSAGNAVAHGVSHDDALAAITLVPAQILGMKDAGRIEPGTPAHVVIWTGDPLELSSRPSHIYIYGAEQSLESRQTRLRDRYSDLANVDTPFANR